MQTWEERTCNARRCYKQDYPQTQAKCSLRVSRWHRLTTTNSIRPTIIMNRVVLAPPIQSNTFQSIANQAWPCALIRCRLARAKQRRKLGPVCSLTGPSVVGARLEQIGLVHNNLNCHLAEQVAAILGAADRANRRDWPGRAVYHLTCTSTRRLFAQVLPLFAKLVYLAFQRVR